MHGRPLYFAPNGTQPNFVTCSEMSKICKWSSKIWGFLPPKTWGPKTAYFRVFLRHINADFFGMKRAVTTNGSLTCPENLVDLVHIRLGLRFSFSPTLCIFRLAHRAVIRLLQLPHVVVVVVAAAAAAVVD